MDNLLTILGFIVGVLSLLVTVILGYEDLAKRLPNVIRTEKVKIAFRIIGFLGLTWAIFGYFILPNTREVEWVPAAGRGLEEKSQQPALKPLQLVQQPGSTKFVKTSSVSSDIFPTSVSFRGDPDGETIYTGLYRGGIYVSHKAGEWQSFGLDNQTVTRVIAYDGPNGGIWASTNLGLYVTFDNGKTWEQKLPIKDLVTDFTIDPENPLNLVIGTLNGIFYSTDGGTTWIDNKDRPQEAITSIVRSPLNPKRLYVMCLFGAIYRSDNGGQDWIQIRESDNEGSTPLAVSPNEENTLFIGPSRKGILKSTDGGQTWESLGLQGVSVSFILVSPTNGMIYAGSDDGRGLYISVDGGRSWKNKDFLTDDIFSITEDPAAPGTLVVTTRNNGVLMSQDLGTTWKDLGLGIVKFERDFAIAKLAILSNDPEHLLAVSSHGLYESKDGGISWNSLRGNSDLFNAYTTSVYVDPSNPEHFFVSAYGGEVYESIDHGNSWKDITYNLSRDGFAPVALMDDGTLYAGPGGLGLWKLVPGAQSWTSVGLAGNSIDQVWADATNHKLFAFDNFGILHLSDNGGETWSDLGERFSAIDINPDITDHMVAVNSENEIVTSHDGGHTWKATGKVEAESQFTHPTVIAATGVPAKFYISNDLFIYSSMDGGDTWKRSNLPEYGDLMAADQNTLYYGGTKALHRSNDAGSVWNPILYKYVDSAGMTSLQIGADSYLTGSKEDGLFISNDKGETWQQTSIGVGYKVLGLTKVNGQSPLIFALIEAPSTELLYALSSDGIRWSLNETGCMNRSETDSSRELLDEGGKIWLVKCSQPKALEIINPQSQSEIVTPVDLQEISSFSDAFYTKENRVMLLSGTSRQPEIWESTDLGKTWMRTSTLSGSRVWVFSDDRRSDAVLINKEGGSVLGSYSPISIIPYSSYIVLILCVILSIIISVKSELIASSWKEIQQGWSWLLFSPHVKTQNLSRFTIFPIMPILALFNIVLFQIFPRSKYLWSAVAAQSDSTTIVSLSELLKRIPAALFTGIGYAFTAATILSIILVLMMVLLMNISAWFINLLKRQPSNHLRWPQAFAKGCLVLILGNYLVTAVGVLLAYLPTIGDSNFGITPQVVLNIVTLFIFYKVLAVSMNSIVDNGNVNYKRVGLIYAILVMIVSFLLATLIVVWILVLIPEQISRLENLPILGFGFLNALLTLVYLTLNQDYRDQIGSTP